MTNEPINFEDKTLVKTIKETVARGLSEPEFEMFAQICKATKLNPFRNEIWAIKTSQRVQIMTGINGFIAIANSNPQYDGMECDVEVGPNGMPTKAVCKVYRKDRRFPSTGIALWSEYAKGSPIWQEKKSHMLLKCAKSIALREAFPQELNGLYTDDEMPREFSRPVEIEKPKEPTYYYYSIPDLTDTQSIWMQDQGANYDQDRGVWVSVKDLGGKLAKYKTEMPAQAEIIDAGKIAKDLKSALGDLIEVETVKISDKEAA